VLFEINTTDDRYYSIGNSCNQYIKKSNYNGVRAALGGQSKVDSTFTLWMNLNLQQNKCY
jgi:hypothetical protein